MNKLLMRVCLRERILVHGKETDCANCMTPAEFAVSLCLPSSHNLDATIGKYGKRKPGITRQKPIQPTAYYTPPSDIHHTYGTYITLLLPGPAMYDPAQEVTSRQKCCEQKSR